MTREQDRSIIFIVALTCVVIVSLFFGREVVNTGTERDNDLKTIDSLTLELYISKVKFDSINELLNIRYSKLKHDYDSVLALKTKIVYERNIAISNLNADETVDLLSRNLSSKDLY